MAETARGSRVVFERIVKRYGATTVLDGVDLEIAPGEFIALLGPSGSGKTTALRCLAGLERPSAGRIIVDDRDVSDVPISKRDIGMVFQAYSLFPHMSALENVGYGLRMRGVGARERRERAEEALDLVGLGALGERYAHELSGGQQQRVALARALVTRPKVLLLDEPLSALDAKVRVQLREEIKRLQSELSITTVFVTHDQEEALAAADRVAVMHDGRIAQIGNPEELYRTPSDAFVAEFVGLSNRVPAVVRGASVELLSTSLPLLGEAQDGLAVRALVRPEHARIVPAGTQGAEPASVVVSAFLGSYRRTQLRLAGDIIFSVQHAADEAYEPGQDVALELAIMPVAVESSH